MGVPLLWQFGPLNDNIVEWGPLVDGLTVNSTPPTYVNDATGTATLLDPNGVPVPGANAEPFAYVATSNGLYRAEFLNGAFNPPLGSGYILEIVLDSATVGHGDWTCKAEVVSRTD
jgi:hypothetical protein